MTIKLTGHIEVAPDELDVIRAYLPAHIRLTRAEQGCLAFTVTQRTDAPHIFDVEELFTDRAAFEAHQARNAYSAWGKATANVTRHVRRRYQLIED